MSHRSLRDPIELWRGHFGDEYIARNTGSETGIQDRARLWAGILDAFGTNQPRRILEVGSNIGDNLRAIRRISSATLLALEPNAEARRLLTEAALLPPDCILEGTATSIPLPDRSVDLAFTCGVLIHIPPDQLAAACREILRVSDRAVVCIEYFSRVPEQITYRGMENMLFKRDFGRFWLDNFPDLRWRDYGFAWEHATGLDDSTWWILERR